MIAGTCDFTEEQGDTFAVRMTWTDENETRVPLAGYTARMQLRASADAEDVILELTTENGRIALDETPGEESISLFVAAEDMAEIVPGSYKYDLEMVAADDYTTKIIKGKFKIVAEVTK